MKEETSKAQPTENRRNGSKPVGYSGQIALRRSNVACTPVCQAMTAKQETVQQPLLSNGFRKKHISTAVREHSNNGGDVFHAVCAEVL
jgi:hypothetical protein